MHNVYKMRGREAIPLDMEEIKRLYREGESLRSIGNRFGVSWSTISRRLEDLWMKTRSRSDSAKKGAKSPCWKGGRRIDKRGYVLVRHNVAYVFEHRLVMEQHLGRELKEEEIVHHKNGDKQDNRIENLELCTASEHRTKHALPAAKWATKHSCCVKCGTTSRKHISRGLCQYCYNNRAWKRRRGHSVSYDENGKRIFSEEHRRKLTEANIRRYSKS